jgi:hypothetical protein
VQRLKVILEKESYFAQKLYACLRPVVKDLVGHDIMLKERALRSLTRPRDFALGLACELLGASDPDLEAVAILLRSAFDHALWKLCSRRAIKFVHKCDVELTTQRLWRRVAHGIDSLAASKPSLVAAIEAHSDLMLADAPTRNVVQAKTKADLEQLRDCLLAGSSVKDPKCVLDAC